MPPKTRTRLSSKQQKCTVYRGELADVRDQRQVDPQPLHVVLIDRDQIPGKSPNVKFMCIGCSTSGVKLGGGKSQEDITRGIEELKDSLEKAKSVVQSLNSSAKAPKAKYFNVLKSGNEYAFELRFSGIPECKNSSGNEKIDRFIGRQPK